MRRIVWSLARLPSNRSHLSQASWGVVRASQLADIVESGAEMAETI
jgi:hypothetical protein